MLKEAGDRSGEGRDLGSIRELADRIHGQLLVPGDENYECARRVFNFMIDRRPAAILRCAGVADVIQGVLFARMQRLPLAIHSGGHGVAGSAVCEGGLMLDLSRMKGMRISPDLGMAQAQPGLLLGEFDHETQAFGLAKRSRCFWSSRRQARHLTRGSGYSR
jgi:hypothetical protein